MNNKIQLDATADPNSDKFPPAFAQRDGMDADPRLAWFREARFGMFIHWGIYAIPAGEWAGERCHFPSEWLMMRREIPRADYMPLAQEFNPIDFDADAIVQLALDAGQKYLVITAKHHDGFCMFQTDQTDFNIVDGTPFGRDIVGELSRACAKVGLPFGLYYSQRQDWTHPDADGNTWDFNPAEQDFDAYLQTCVKPHLRDLLTNYGPIALIWFDTPRDISAEHSAQLADLVHELQPNCLVNGRIGHGLGDYGQSRDNAIPDEGFGDWEIPVTGNDSWGFSFDESWKTPRELVGVLVEVVSKNGNVLLNIGPDALGVVPQASVDQFRAIGEWLKRNGEAIYGSNAGRWQGLESVYATRNSDSDFLIVRDWPADGVLRVPRDGVEVAEVRAQMLGEDGDLSVTDEAGQLAISLPAATSEQIYPVVALRHRAEAGAGRGEV